MESGESVESMEIRTISTPTTDLATEDHQKPRSSVLTKLESWLSPVLVSRQPALSSSAGLLERFKYSCLCPPHGWCGDLLTLATVLLTVWAVSPTRGGVTLSLSSEVTSSPLGGTAVGDQ